MSTQQPTATPGTTTALRRRHSVPGRSVVFGTDGSPLPYAAAAIQAAAADGQVTVLSPAATSEQATVDALHSTIATHAARIHFTLLPQLQTLKPGELTEDLYDTLRTLHNDAAQGMIVLVDSHLIDDRVADDLVTFLVTGLAEGAMRYRNSSQRTLTDLRQRRGVEPQVHVLHTRPGRCGKSVGPTSLIASADLVVTAEIKDAVLAAQTRKSRDAAEHLSIPISIVEGTRVPDDRYSYIHTPHLNVGAVDSPDPTSL